MIVLNLLIISTNLINSACLVSAKCRQNESLTASVRFLLKMYFNMNTTALFLNKLYYYIKSTCITHTYINIQIYPTINHTYVPQITCVCVCVCVCVCIYIYILYKIYKYVYNAQI